MALVLTKLDYGSATLASFRSNSWRGFQSAQDTAAQLIFKACRQDHIQPLLRSVQITLASDARTYFVPAGSAGVSLPPRLCTWLPGLRSSARHISTHVCNCALQLHQCWSLHALCVLPLATTSFERLPHQSGTVCRSQSGHRRRCKFSAAD